MKASETAALLTYAAALDGRDASRATAQAWADVLDDHMLYADAMSILKSHYADSKWKIMPADINERSRELRRARQDSAIRDHPPIAPPEALDPDDPSQSIGWTRAYWKAIGDGQNPSDADLTACEALGVARTQIQAADGGKERLDKIVKQSARNTHLPRRE